MEVALAKAAIEPLSAALGAGLATVLMLAFALAWRRLALREEEQLLARVAALEAAQPKGDPVTWPALGAKLDIVHNKTNNTQSDLESLDAVLVATGVLKQTVVIRRRPS